MSTYAQLFGEAWDGAGSEYFALSERQALCALAQVAIECARADWRDVPPSTRERLVRAGRRAISLGNACAMLALNARK